MGFIAPAIALPCDYVGNEQSDKRKFAIKGIFMKKATAILLAMILLLTGCGVMDPVVTTTANTQPTQESALRVHFLDVGQADCALLECDGEYIIIDGGNVDDSSLVVSYLQQQGVTRLEAVIATHAHEDHVGGLPGVLAVYETAAVYAPTRTYSSGCFDDFLYYTNQQGLEVTIPAPGDVISFGSATATVLGPVQSYADPNDTSIVLMVQLGDTRFLFTGDMETQAENDMLDYWGERFDWHADVLKVGHHGSETSTGYRFLRAVMPTYGVISVGEGNSYGHPHEAPLSRLRDAEVTLYRTDTLGSIVAVTDGVAVTFSWNNGSVTPEQPTTTQPQGQTYIGNRNSKKLHLPTCSSLPSEENRVYFDSYEEAIRAGYEPCGNCLG